MFAASINNISRNAGHGLAGFAGVFYVRTYCTTLYRCPSTPVHRLNGHAAFLDECDRQRDRLGHFLFLLCYTTSRFPTPDCLPATGRRPTRRARTSHPSPGVPTPTWHAWASTCTAATSATSAGQTPTGRPSPGHSTSAAPATPRAPRPTRSSSEGSSPNGRRSKPGTGSAARPNDCATRCPSSAAIRTLPSCPPTCRKPAFKPCRLITEAAPPQGAARDGHTHNRRRFTNP